MSSSRERIAARVPQRARGKRRVAALLEAAASLFAEKGYDAVTMTEIAARAGAPIGSLYQFFAGKEALAEAILKRFGARLEEALNGIEERASTLTTAELAEALLGVLPGLREERATTSVLIEARQESSRRAAELRISLRRQVARILQARIPRIPPRRAETMALVVVQLMKAAARQDAEKDPAARDDAPRELNYLINLYLCDAAGPRTWVCESAPAIS